MFTINQAKNGIKVQGIAEGGGGAIDSEILSNIMVKVNNIETSMVEKTDFEDKGPYPTKIFVDNNFLSLQNYTTDKATFIKTGDMNKIIQRIDDINNDISDIYVQKDNYVLTTFLENNYYDKNIVDSAINNISLTPGPKGDKGDKGENGAKGEPGKDGINGINGIDGAKGDKGDKGDAGINGIDGKDGKDGINGIDGKNGLQGIQGVQGIQGLKGEKGDKGDKGDAGTPGADATVDVSQFVKKSSTDKVKLDYTEFEITDNYDNQQVVYIGDTNDGSGKRINIGNENINDINITARNIARYASDGWKYTDRLFVYSSYLERAISVGKNGETLFCSIYSKIDDEDFGGFVKNVIRISADIDVSGNFKTPSIDLGHNFYIKTVPNLQDSNQYDLVIRYQSGDYFTEAFRWDEAYGFLTIYSPDIIMKGGISYESSTTITHYAPAEEPIENYVLGTPVYMTGKVYKRRKDNWILSTNTDYSDCISSVKNNGYWKEYLGICVKIDYENKSIKFATHGDYLVKVKNSDSYGIGDTIFIEDEILKILSDNANLTTKINRTIVGVITAIIDETTLAIMKD